MPTVDHWEVKDIKAETFTGDNQADVFDEVNTWLQQHEDIVILSMAVTKVDEFQTFLVCYEE